jgi:hypothetical protein
MASANKNFLTDQKNKCLNANQIQLLEQSKTVKRK